MGSSLATGLRALAETDAEAAVVALADQPLVGAEAVRRLIAAYAGGASVAVAAYDGKPRNPVLIARGHWPAVIELATGDTGARAFLRARPGLVTQVECGDTGSPDDVDTAEDLARVRGGRYRYVRKKSPDAPPAADGFLWLQHQQVLAGDERVRRAGHRLHGQRGPAVLRLERVAGEDLQPAVALVRPQPGGRAVRRQPDPGQAVRLPAQAGERVVEPGGAELARGAEVEIGSGHVFRRAGRDAALVGWQPVAGGQRQLAVVDDRRRHGQVRVRARRPTAPGGCPC